MQKKAIVIDKDDITVATKKSMNYKVRDKETFDRGTFTKSLAGSLGFSFEALKIFGRF